MVNANVIALDLFAMTLNFRFLFVVVRCHARCAIRDLRTRTDVNHAMLIVREKLTVITRNRLIY